MSVSFRLPLIAGLIALPALAHGESLTCAFDTECLDTEACNATDYEVTFGALDDRWLMSSIAGERPFDQLAEDDGGRAFVSPNTNGAVGLLQIGPDGSSNYGEIGIAFPYRASYSGQCTPS